MSPELHAKAETGELTYAQLHPVRELGGATPRGTDNTDVIAG